MRMDWISGLLMGLGMVLAAAILNQILGIIKMVLENKKARRGGNHDEQGTKE